MLLGTLGLSDSVYIDWGDTQKMGGNFQPPFTHNYAQPGPYTVTVTAFDTLCSTQSSQQIQVLIASPQAPKAAMNLVYNPCDTSLHVELHPTDSLVSNALLVFWGDGSSHYERMQCPLIHNYRGIYGPTTITLIAFDTLCGASDTATFVVTYRPPLGAINGEVIVNPLRGCAGHFWAGDGQLFHPCALVPEWLHPARPGRPRASLASARSWHV